MSAADARTSLLMEDARRTCARLDLSPLEGKTVMVAGASGLVGVHLLACLRHWAQTRRPMTTVALTRGPAAAPVRALLDYVGAKALNGDVGDPAFLASLPPADYVIHAAGYGQPGRFMEDPAATLRLNTAGTRGLLDKLNAGGKFLFVSSSEVYNGLSGPPFDETRVGPSDPAHPRACYIEGKRGGEAVCAEYRAKGVQAKSARLCYAYGPGASTGDKRVLSAFIEKALTEKKITMLDRGQAMRTYCYIGDAVYMLWRILLDGKEAVYNVGGASRLSIAELAGKVGAIARIPVVVPASTGGSPGAPDDSWVDIGRFEREFHPMDFLPLDQGLRNAVAWHEAARA